VLDTPAVPDASGLVDAAAVPAEAAPAGRSAVVAAAVDAAWRSALETTDLDADADFFDLGGHSLLVLKAISRIQRDLGVEVPVDQFWDTPRLGDFRVAVEALLPDQAKG
jgi:acyl carrier protein